MRLHQHDIMSERKWLVGCVIPDLIKLSKLIDEETENLCTLENFLLKHIEIEPICPRDKSWLPDWYRAKLLYELDGKWGEFTFIVNKVPEHKEVQVYSKEDLGYLAYATALSHEWQHMAMIVAEVRPKNQLIVFREIIAAFEKFGNTKLNVGEVYCYSSKDNITSLILSDIASKGFRVAVQHYNLGLEHILVAVKYLARFHSIGFAMRHKNLNKYEGLTADLQCRSDIFDNECKSFKETIQRMEKATRRYQPTVPTEFLGILSMGMADDNLYNKKLPVPRHPYITLCHGNFMLDNIAFKYEFEDHFQRSPTDVMMLDFQTLRSSSPMLDLTTFLALSTFSGERASNFKLIFQTYIDELGAGFERLTGEKAPTYLEYETLFKEYVRFLPYSLSLSSSYLTNLAETLPILKAENRFDSHIIDTEKSILGHEVDQEIAFQVRELFDFTQDLKIDIYKELFALKFLSDSPEYCNT